MKKAVLILTGLLAFAFESGDAFQCSIKYDKYDRAAMLSRNFVVGDKRWPNATVPYQISPDFSESDVKNILTTLDIIMESTCVKFVNYTTEPHHLKFLTGKSGCYANLGFSRHREWIMVHLQGDSYCTGTGIIGHETLHALGFLHEHQRPDRDEFVKVQFQNIKEGIRSNWYRTAAVDEDPLPPRCNSGMTGEELNAGCYNGVKTETFGVPYDYASVLHYYVGKVNGSTSSMYPIKKVDSWICIGCYKAISHYDFLKVNKAYPCDKVITTLKPTTTTTKKPCTDYYGNCADFITSCKTWKLVADGCHKTCGTCE